MSEGLPCTWLHVCGGIAVFHFEMGGGRRAPMREERRGGGKALNIFEVVRRRLLGGRGGSGARG